MRRTWRIVIVAASVFAWLLSGPSCAQEDSPRGRDSRPAYSPYLNLSRGGSAARNYHGLVRPELEFRSSDSQLRSSIERLDRTTGRDHARIRRLEQHSGNPNPPTSLEKLPETGHATQFMDFSRYFLRVVEKNR